MLSARHGFLAGLRLARRFGAVPVRLQDNHAPAALRLLPSVPVRLAVALAGALGFGVLAAAATRHTDPHRFARLRHGRMRVLPLLLPGGLNGPLDLARVASSRTGCGRQVRERSGWP